MPSIEDIQHIYYLFRKCQASFNDRGFRMPKDFESHYKNKLGETNRKALYKITARFQTKWINIDPEMYFDCGFHLYKKQFTYTKFFKEPILKLYISRDKIKKREVSAKKESIIKSARHVKDTGFSLRDYVLTKDGELSLPISDYVKNNIDAHFLVWLIKRHNLHLTDSDRSVIPYIHDNFRKINFEVIQMQNFLRKVEEKL